MQAQSTIPLGLCQCGCGQPTRIAPRTSTRDKWVKGRPLQFVKNHQSGYVDAADPASLYVAEDRGYRTPCWIWQLHIGWLGYGHYGHARKAHVVFYERRYGPVPEGLELDHLCRTRACVNPDHLEPVTHAVNVQRSRVAKLTPALVREIRSLWETGRYTKRDLGRQFGVSEVLIGHVVRRQVWKNV